MKNLITKLVAISILLVVVGCGSARQHIIEYYPDGNKKSEKLVKYNRYGSGELNAVESDIIKGTAKIGSQKGSAGDLAGALLNLSEIAKKGAGIVP